MNRIRVLVAEDSLTIRRRLCDILNGDPELQVVGEAENGKRAIELCEELRPDVITLDIVMPVMSGLTAAEYIMAYRPTPILIVSASTNRGELFKTYDALAAGALDVLEKASEWDDAWEARLRSVVKLISRIKVITHPRARLNGASVAPERLPAATRASGTEAELPYSLVAIGASTGGPAAIVAVLRSLPPGLPVPVIFVLHIDEPFGAAFAEWLESQTPHPVVYARGGEKLDALRGTIIMAPAGKHLTLAGGRLSLSVQPPRHSCRPSIDVLFESLAADRGAEVVACLLTGMGRDGAAGLLSIRRAGGFTIAQDEGTSVIYGMPREAVSLGAAQAVLPLDEIGTQIFRLLSKTTAGEP
jgi:two-component system chemotaxis response regulator CheB